MRSAAANWRGSAVIAHLGEKPAQSAVLILFSSCRAATVCRCCSGRPRWTVGRGDRGGAAPVNRPRGAAFTMLVYMCRASGGRPPGCEAHPGATSAVTAASMKKMLLKPLVGGTGFTGNSPGGLSRWSGRERKPVPLLPKLVAEVSADHIENSRFRHGSRLIRWRDDKEPRACTMDQIERS